MRLKSLAFSIGLICVYEAVFAQEISNDVTQTNTVDVIADTAATATPMQPVSQDTQVTDIVTYVPITDGIDKALVDAYTQYTKATLLDDSINTKLVDDISNATMSLAIENNNLKVVFDDKKLAQIAKDNQKQIFTGVKSSMMAFVVVNTNNTTNIAQGADSSSFLTRFDKSAEPLNFSIIYPLLDLNDIQTFNEQSVLAHNDKALAQAAMRYGSEFFISATLKHEGGGFVSFTYNLYNSQGQRLTGERLVGQEQILADKLAKNIALAIASIKAGDSVAELASLQRIDNIYELGPNDGFVRMSISEVNSLFDIANIKKILISYGYESDVKIVAMHGHDLIIEIPTNSSPAILDGTMRNARDFKKNGSWQYTYLKSIN